MIRALAWVAATTIGLAVGGFVFHFPGSFGESDWNLVGLVFGGLIGAMNGVGVGLLQWLAVGGSRRTGGRLIGAMALGLGASHALADGVSRDATLVVVAGLGALAVTAALAWSFGERRPVPLAASFLGWAGGWLAGAWLTGALGMPWSETPVGWSTEHAVVGVIVVD